MGKIDASSLSRKDKRFFKKDILPGEVPDIEFSIVVDESGSMHGSRIENAKLAAYQFYKAARLIGAKASVISQTTVGFNSSAAKEPVRLHIYADSEDGVSVEKDCNNILSIGTYGLYNNRDGYAYRYAIRRLATSDAAKKVCIYISDGAPAAAEYAEYQGKNDIKSGLKEAKKLGIETVTFGFGSDASKIRKVWCEDNSKKNQPNFIEVANINELSKKMLRVFSKMLDV